MDYNLRFTDHMDCQKAHVVFRHLDLQAKNADSQRIGIDIPLSDEALSINYTLRAKITERVLSRFLTAVAFRS